MKSGGEAESRASATACATASSVPSGAGRAECAEASCWASCSARMKDSRRTCSATSGRPGSITCSPSPGKTSRSLSPVSSVSPGSSGFRASGVELVGRSVIAAYVLAVGWQPSVARAGVAGALASLAWLTARPRDRWYLLAVGGLVLLAWMPTALLDPGFQLSFAAVAAIFVAVPRVERRLDGYPLPASSRTRSPSHSRAAWRQRRSCCSTSTARRSTPWLPTWLPFRPRRSSSASGCWPRWSIPCRRQRQQACPRSPAGRPPGLSSSHVSSAAFPPRRSGHTSRWPSRPSPQWRGSSQPGRTGSSPPPHDTAPSCSPPSELRCSLGSSSLPCGPRRRGTHRSRSVSRSWTWARGIRRSSRHRAHASSWTRARPRQTWRGSSRAWESTRSARWS